MGKVIKVIALVLTVALLVAGITGYVIGNGFVFVVGCFGFVTGVVYSLQAWREDRRNPAVRGGERSSS